MAEYYEILDKARAQKSKIVKFLRKIKKNPPKNFETLFNQAQEKAVQRVDCTRCARCCKELGPRVYKRDVERFSKVLGMTTSEAFETYFRLDEDGDYVFKSMPCPFIDESNLCRIYPQRPKACADYPNILERGVKTRLTLLEKNLLICPMIYIAVEYVMKESR